MSNYSQDCQGSFFPPTLKGVILSAIRPFFLLSLLELFLSSIYSHNAAFTITCKILLESLCLPLAGGTLQVLSASLLFCISFLTRPVKEHECLLESLSAWGFFTLALPLLHHTCSERIFWFSLLILKRALRRLWGLFSALYIKVGWLIIIIDIGSCSFYLLSLVCHLCKSLCLLWPQTVSLTLARIW